MPDRPASGFRWPGRRARGRPRPKPRSGNAPVSRGRRRAWSGPAPSGPSRSPPGRRPARRRCAIVTSRAGATRSASRPPLMRERCLRTVLISRSRRPRPSSARVTACFSGERQAGGRRDPVGRCAAGDQHQDEVAGAGAVGQRERFDGRRESGRVGNRMAGLDHPHDCGSDAHSRAGSPRGRQADRPRRPHRSR